MEQILMAVIPVVIIGIICAAVLVVASKLMAVKEDLEKLRGKQVSTVELVDWMDKLVVAHTINEALKIEDDSKPTCVGDESSFVYVEGSDEIND